MITFLMFCVGVGLLVFGADRLVAGASGLARRLNIPSVVIGLTIVALGTSTPELFVSCVSAAQGKADIALGNVVGSNIGNLLLILGVTAMVMPLTVGQRLLCFDAQIMAASAALLAFMSLDGVISRGEGTLLLVALLTYLVVSVKISGTTGDSSGDVRPMSGPSSALWIVVGLGALIAGSQFVLSSSVTLAQALGLSELVIGLTIVAVGTSLPEIATSLMAARRGDADMSVGNIVGSNILNIVAILGASSVIAPTGLEVSESARLFDIPIMLVVSLLVIPLFWTHGKITRLDSLVLCAGYCLYVASLLVDCKEPTARRSLVIAVAVYLVFSVVVVYQGLRATLRDPAHIAEVVE
jgi:cation:H+ antiporter